MFIKDLLWWSPIYDFLRLILHKVRFFYWERSGRPLPPPELFKQRVVKEYAGRFSLQVLVETGTYLGDMVDATKDTFRQIFSIELAPVLCKRAQRRFAKHSHIKIIQGDSAKVLSKVLANISKPCLFWLDAHCSGGVTTMGKTVTPIRKELQQILNHPIQNHVILIDDARGFIGENDYPTIGEIRKLLFKKQRSQNLELIVAGDIIQIYPKTKSDDKK